MTSADRWYELPDVAAILAQPDDEYLARLAATNDALRAARIQRLLDDEVARERDAILDAQRCDEWLESPAARDYLPSSEE